MTDKLLTVADAAGELGVSPGRVRQLIREKRLPVERYGTRTVLIRAENLALVRERKRTGRPPRSDTPSPAALAKRRSRERLKGRE